jgi:hypothetical protein
MKLLADFDGRFYRSYHGCSNNLMGIKVNILAVVLQVDADDATLNVIRNKRSFEFLDPVEEKYVHAWLVFSSGLASFSKIDA